MTNHNSSSKYLILILTLVTLLAFFVMQAGAVTTVTTPITGTVSTSDSSPDIQILVSSDGNTLSSDAGGNGIGAGPNGTVSIDKMPGGPDSLAISADKNGVWVRSGGTVSSDADLVINSGGKGVENDDGTVNLAGVSIDAKDDGVLAYGEHAVTKITPTSGHHTIISANGYGIIADSSGDVQIGRGSGELTINGHDGVWVGSGSTVSSDADLVIKASSGVGIANYSGGTVNLAGVSIDAVGHGIYNLNKSTTDISGDQALIKVATSGSYAAAIDNNGGSVSIKTSGDVLLAAKSNATLRDASSLISNSGSGTVSIDAGGQVTFDVTAQSAQGMYNTTSLGSGVTVSAAKGSNYIVTATSGGATGIGASGAALDYGQVNNVAVSATGGDAYGLEATNGGKVSGDAAYKMQTLSVSSDKKAYGIFADGINSASSVSDVRVGQLTVNSGGAASGISTAPNGSVSADVDSMSVTGAGKAYGIENYYSTVKLAMSGDMDVRSTGGDADGIFTIDRQTAFSGVKSLNVSSDKSSATGIYAESDGKINGNLESMNVYGGSGASGIYANLHTSVDLAMSGDLNVRGSGAKAEVYGVYEAQGSAVTFTGVKNMTVSADGAGAAAYGVNAPYVNSNSSTVSGDMQSLTVTSAHGAAYGVDVSSDKVSSIDIANGLTVSGANGGAGIYLTGAKHSVSVGGALKATGVQYGIYNNGGTVDPNGINITVSDNGIYTSGDQAVTQVSPTSKDALISSTGADGVKAENSGQVLIGYGDGTPLVINSGSKGIEVASSGLVSSDADLVIKSGSNGVYNSGGTVNLAGVSIDASPQKINIGTGAIDTTAGGVTTIRTNKGGSGIAVNGGNGRGISAAGGGVVNVLKGSASSLTITQKDAMQFGIYADGSGSAVNSSADVVVSGQSIYNAAIEAANGGSVTIDGSVSADETGDVSSGLIVRDGGGNKITVGGDYKASVTGYGIWAKTATDSGYTTNEIDVKGNATIKGTDDNSIGIENDNAKVAIGGSADIATTTGVGVSNTGTATVGGALTVRSGANAIENSGAFAALGGVSIDAASAGSIAGVKTTGSGNTTISGDKALIKAVTSGSGATAYAVSDEGSGAVSVDVTGDIELTASAQNGYAAAVNGSNVTLKAGGQASFDVTGHTAKGLYKYGSSSQNITVDAKGGSNYKVTSTAGDAYGIETNGAALNYGKVNNVVVEATNGNAWGLSAVSGGVLSGDGVNAIKNISVTANKTFNMAYGIYASSDGTVSSDVQNISVSGSNDGYGIGAFDKSSVTFTGLQTMNVSAGINSAYGIEADNSSVSGDAGSITVRGANAYGINALSSADIQLTLSGDLTAESSEGRAFGIEVNSGKVSSIDIKGDLNVRGATGGWGIYAGGAAHKITVGGVADVDLQNDWSEAYAINADNDTTITVGGLSADVSSSASAYGVRAADGGSVTTGSGGKSLRVVSSNDAAYGIDINSNNVSSIDIVDDLTVKGAKGGTGITAQGAAHQITVGGLTDVSIAASGDNAIYAADKSNVKLNGGVSLDVTGTGEVSGIKAENGGSVTVSGDKAIVKATTTGSGATAYAISNAGSGSVSVDVTGDIELTASAQNGNAAAVNGGNITLKAGGQASFDVTGLTAKGLYKSSAASGATVDAAGGSNYAIKATNGEAYGIETDGAALNYGKVNNVVVEATGGNAYGLAATNHGTLSGDAKSAIKNITVTENTAGKTAYGILVSDDSTVNAASIDAISVSSAGTGYGVLVNDNSKLTAKIGAITVNASDDAYGLYAPSTTSTLDVSISGPVKVTTEKGKAIGVYSASGGVTVSDDKAVITAISKSGDASAITPDSGDITVKETSGVDLTAKTDEGTATGVDVSTGKTVDVTTGGAVSADVSGASAYGFKAEKGSTKTDSLIDIATSEDITVKATATSGDAAGFYASGDIAKITYKADGALDLNVSNASGDAYGIRTANGGVISGDTANSGSVTVTADGGNAYGIDAKNGSEVKAANIGSVTVSSTANAVGVNAANSSAAISGMKDLSVTADKTAYGVEAYDNASVSGDLGGLTVTANEATGVTANGGGTTVKLALGGNMSVTGTNYASGADISGGSNAALVLNGGADINSATGTAVGADTSNSSLKLAMNGDLNVSGDHAWGIEAYDSASVDVSGLKNLTVTGSAVGFIAESSDLKATLAGDVTINSTSRDAYGLQANASSVDVSGVRNMTVTAASGDANGLLAVDSRVSADLGSLSVISPVGEVYGVYISSDKISSIDITKDLTVKGAAGGAGITAIGGAAHQITVGGLTDVSLKNGAAETSAIYADGSAIKLNGGLSADVAVTSPDTAAYGVRVENSGSVTTGSGGKSLSVSSATGSAYGIDISSNKVSSIDIVDDLTVKGAKGGTGITAQGAAHTVTVGGLTDVSIAASGDNGVYAADNSNVNLNGGVSLDVTGDGDVSGIRAENGGKITVSGDKAAEIAVKSTGGNAYGILVSGDQASVKFNKINSIAVSSAGSGYGLYANSSTDVSGTINNITVSASGDAYGIYAPDKSTSLDVKVTGVISVDSANGKALSIYSNAGIIATEANDASIIGDVKAEGGSQQAINMTSSDLTGAVNATGGATVGLSLDAKSVWYVTGASNTNGELAVNDGTVNFLQTGANSDDVNQYRKVEVQTLSGQRGVFKMHADISADVCDQIVADNSDNLFGKIEIVSPKKTGPYRARMTNDLVIVRNDKNSSFTLLNNGGYYEYGAWKFVLASEDLTGAAIANVTGVSSLAAASDTSGLGWYLLNTGKASNTVTAVFNSLMAPGIGHLEEGALYSQLGDPAYDAVSGDRETHVWGYAVYSKFKYTDHVTTPIEGTATGDNYAENKYYGLTGGMDKIVHENDSGTLRLGAMMGYGEGDLDMDNGDASDNSFHAGVYGIYKWTNGLYLAGVAKYNRYRTDITARPTEGGAYEASYNQDGFGISALAGKRFDLKNSWYIEPQAELGLARIGSASYTINNSDVEIDSTNSVRGRLGFSLGRKVITTAGKTLDFYVKASILREFDGETDLTMSGDPFKADFGGTWGQYKLGVNYWNNDNFMLHGALVYENGENYESPIGVELGLNWYTGPKPQKDEAETEVTE